ncbi:MAG: beta-ketoacyl-ACP synthase II [Brevinematales bacterium]|nr:beta-ketoacyl-ACP synthase II [Brevinematales bacterium]
MSKRRVVITGMGTVNALGLSVQECWENLIAGKSGITNITNQDMGDSPCKYAGEIKNEKFIVENYIDRKKAGRMDRFTQFGYVAAKEAIEHSKLPEYTELDKENVGVLIGSGIGGIYCFCDNVLILDRQGHKRVSPLFIPKIITDITSGHVSIEYGYRGPNYSISSACASASHSIAVSYMHIINEDADVMVTGGSEAAMNPLGIAGFTQAQALSTHYYDNPAISSRPFDTGRDGFVMAEGAGVMVLEEYEHAKKRGATIYAEMLGYGMSGDANHITAPCPDGSGAALAIERALKRSGLKMTDIQLVNTHGTSTQLGDIAETTAVKRVFGDHAYKLKVNSTKSMTGHTLGAAGGIEAVAVVKMLETGIIHPTINLDNPDPECDLDYVPNKAIEYPVDYAISDSFGFGGHNVTVVFKKFRG